MNEEIKERFEETGSIYYHSVKNTSKAVKNVSVHYPMLCGKNCEWEILYEITKIDEDFWNIHEGWKRFFVNIFDNALCDNGQKKVTCEFREFMDDFGRETKDELARFVVEK
ncbi:MAG: hypothetical protein K2K70_11470 [Lachnospiraceae bacterium]|nr:hypothetical protein [Lachnospiraceae bacterium]